MHIYTVCAYLSSSPEDLLNPFYLVLITFSRQLLDAHAADNMNNPDKPTEDEHHVVAIDSNDTDSDGKSGSRHLAAASDSWISKMLKSRFAHSTPIGRYVSDKVGLRADGNEHESPSWTSTFIRFGPLSGIFTMFLTIGSLIASLGILGR